MEGILGALSLFNFATTLAELNQAMPGFGDKVIDLLKKYELDEDKSKEETDKAEAKADEKIQVLGVKRTDGVLLMNFTDGTHYSNVYGPDPNLTDVYNGICTCIAKKVVDDHQLDDWVQQAFMRFKGEEASAEEPVKDPGSKDKDDSREETKKRTQQEYRWVGYDSRRAGQGNHEVCGLLTIGIRA